MYRVENKEDAYHWFNVENLFNSYSAFAIEGEQYGYNDVTIKSSNKYSSERVMWLKFVIVDGYFRATCRYKIGLCFQWIVADELYLSIILCLTP